MNKKVLKSARPTFASEPSLDEIYNISGIPYVSPSHEVKRLAKEVGMEGKVKVMNFGVDGQVAEVKHAVEDCIQTGYWLLLQNYHLAEEPEQEFFQLLKVCKKF